MNISDFEYLKQNLNTSELMGSDSCLGNIFLLKEKYNTNIKIQNNFLFRQYFGKENRYGYAFPLSLSQKPQKLSDAIKIIFKENQYKDIQFCLSTQTQKNELDTCLLEHFPQYKIDWKTKRDDYDYIYLQEKLANLSGASLQKKKNHVSKFLRTYQDEWEFKLFPENNLTEEILEIENNWLSEHIEKNEQNIDLNTLLLEKESIKSALQNAKLLSIIGGVLFISGKPVAMTLASPISSETLDIHFEKVLHEAAQNGGYAAINYYFAKNCSQYKYLNREEDMGIEGLRKSKLSYKPEILLEKFYGKVIKC